MQKQLVYLYLVTEYKTGFIRLTSVKLKFFKPEKPQAIYPVPGIGLATDSVEPAGKERVRSTI
jgi:hypothetical protein